MLCAESALQAYSTAPTCLLRHRQLHVLSVREPCVYFTTASQTQTSSRMQRAKHMP